MASFVVHHKGFFLDMKDEGLQVFVSKKDVVEKDLEIGEMDDCNVRDSTMQKVEEG
jgi:hypothetical protein